MKKNILRNRNFTLLMVAKAVSFIGTYMQEFALSLYVLAVTGSATKFASVLAIGIVPQIILGPIAGVFADWLDKKKIIVYLDLMSGLIIAAFAMDYYINNSFSMWHIYTIVILLSLISVLYDPTVRTIIPSIVDKDDLASANAINSVILNICSLFSPAIAGVIYGISGIFIVLLINSISFILSAIVELFIAIPNNSKKPEKIGFKVFIKDFSEGIGFIKCNKLILSIVTLALVINFALSPIISMGLPYISKRILKITDFQYGVMQSILAVSTIISPIVYSILSKRMKTGRIIFLDILICSILMVFFAIIPSGLYTGMFSSNFVPYLSMILVGCMILFVTSIGSISLVTMIQQEVPLTLMGRVNSSMATVCMAAIPLGQIIFGILFDKTEAWITVMIGTCIAFITIMSFRKVLVTAEDESSISEEIASEFNSTR